MRSIHPRTKRARRVPIVRVVLALLPALLWTVGASLHADDRDLLRTGSGTKPQLFILLDTSQSMNLKLGVDASGTAAPSPAAWPTGGADGPDSRLYQARQALYNVFHDVNDIGFGFASMNQDFVHIVTKHWIYFNNTPLNDSSWTDAWPIDFPTADTQCEGPVPDCLTTMIDVPSEDTNGDGTIDNNDVGDGIPETRIGDVQGDTLTFGPGYTTAKYFEPGVAGSCAPVDVDLDGTIDFTPLDLDTTLGRKQAETFGISGTPASPTRLWVEQGGVTYLMQVNMADPTQLGSDNMTVHIALDEVTTCPSTFGTHYERDFTLRLDPNLGPMFFADSTAVGTGNARPERNAGLWDYLDVRSNADFGEDHPFTGKGWEGNYDSGDSYCDQIDSTDPNSGATCLAFDNEIGLVRADRWEDASCRDMAGDPINDASCEIKPIAHTTYASLNLPGVTDYHPLDKGDVIPWSWIEDNKAAFLNRVAPIGPDGNREYRGAPFFADQVSAATNGLPLLTSVRPLLAADHTPLSKMYNDFRCWFLGSQLDNTGKCENTNFYAAGGYLGLACAGDKDLGCRRFYAIVISDGESTPDDTGENARADESDMFVQATLRTWTLNVGRPGGCKTGLLNAMTNANHGEECINVESQAQLNFELRNILTQIREDSLAFASAAVPSVQATVEQKVFLTSFNPLNGAAYWPGKVDAYLKPLPLVADKPDPSVQCDASTTQGCHLWDGGQVLLSQIPDDITTGDALGGLTTQRRVFYSRLSTPGNWWRHRRMFDPPPSASGNPQTPIRYDFWRGLGIIPALTPDGGLTAAEETTATSDALSVIQTTLEEKTGTIDTVDSSGNTISTTVTYNMTDDFHSTPIVVGNPPSAFLFATDAAGNGASCNDTTTPNRGYRCFFAKHQDRRKVLLFGTDSGMLEAINAGIFHGDGTVGTTDGSDPVTGRSLDEEFDNGTGNELWTYMPRPLMPTVTQLTQSQTQLYGVDGPPVAADVFIDPAPDTSGGSPIYNPNNRQWRTVVIGGFREAGSDLAALDVNGGRGYYALDITQPDVIDSTTNIPQPTDAWMPSCLGSGAQLDGSSTADSQAPADCGPLPYPAALWEFTDSVLTPILDADSNPAGLTTVPLDEDQNTFPDLADTWSTPSIGRILVCTDPAGNCDRTSPDNANPYDPASPGDLRVVSVAIFGGGMDSTVKTTPTSSAASGNWLYMVDIETGQTIYKRELIGPAPSAPAAVDTNQDGYIDRIYIGTIAGLMYRVDLADDTSGATPAVPALESTSVLDIFANSHDVMRITTPLWNPHILFNANYDDTTLIAGVRPIYYRPSVIFVARLGKYALSFGTGDREDLWDITGTAGRFYVFVDNVVFPPGGPDPAPLNEGNLQRFNTDSSPTVGDFLIDPTFNGWYLVLNPDERVITDSFALSGVTIFSSFEPLLQTAGNTASAACTGDSTNQSNNIGPICSRRGTSNIYAVNTTNANGLLETYTTGEQTRFVTVSTFVSNPFAEPSATKKSGTTQTTTGDTLDTRLTNIMNTLKGLFPKNCQFANYRIDVKTIAADTRLQFIAPVPICLVEKNWKEY